MENLQKTKGPALNGKQNHSRKSLFFDLCLYTVLYGMAYLLKEKGYAVLSFFCFLILSLYLFLREREREGSSVTLPGLFALGLLFGEGVATLQLSKLSSPWTIHTWLSFYLAYLLFYLGYHGRTYLSEFAASRSLKNTKIFSEEAKKVDLSGKEYRWNFTEGQFLKLCILGLLLLSYFSFVIEALALGYIPLFTEHTPHAYSYFHLKGLHYFTTLFVLVPMLLPFLYQKEGSLKLFSGISLFLALLLPILLVSRFQLLFSLFLFVFSALYQGLRIRKRYLLLLFLFLLSAYVFLTIERAHSVSYLMGIFEMKNDKLPIFLVQPYMYIANNYENFNLLTKNIEEHSHGFRMAYPFFTLSGAKFFFDFPLAYPVYLTKEELSTLGILYDAYYDFGLLGVMLFSLILGLLSSWIKELSRKEKNPFGGALYIQFAFYFLFSFFTTWFSNASSIFYFAVTLVLAFLWNGFVHEKNSAVSI